jgi:hypothetical protein
VGRSLVLVQVLVPVLGLVRLVEAVHGKHLVGLGGLGLGCLVVGFGLGLAQRRIVGAWRGRLLVGRAGLLGIVCLPGARATGGTGALEVLVMVMRRLRAEGTGMARLRRVLF